MRVIIELEQDLYIGVPLEHNIIISGQSVFHIAFQLSVIACDQGLPSEPTPKEYYHTLWQLGIDLGTVELTPGRSAHFRLAREVTLPGPLTATYADELLCQLGAAKDELTAADVCGELRGWLRAGGPGPKWSACPDGTKRFRAKPGGPK